MILSSMDSQRTGDPLYLTDARVRTPLVNRTWMTYKKSECHLYKDPMLPIRKHKSNYIDKLMNVVETHISSSVEYLRTFLMLTNTISSAMPRH